MADIKTDAELYAQVTAGIRVNGNREITPPIHKSIEDNIIASKLSIRDGGLVVQSLTGYNTELTPSDNKHFTTKKYVDDGLANGRTENFNWRFSTSTTASDPGAGFFRANNATASLVTELYVDSICSETGLNIDTIFTVINGDWSIYIQQTGDATKFAQYSTSVPYINNTGWWTIPVTYIQSGSGGGLTNNTKCTFYLTNKNSLPNDRELNINGVNYNLSADREWRTGLADTGVLTYAGASASSATQINIGPVTGYIVDNETTPGIPVYTYINYPGESNKTVPTLGSGLASYVMLSPNGFGGGTISFQNTFPTSEERKTMIYLSKIGHPSGSITTVGNEPDFIISPLGQLRDLSKSIGFINNGVVPSANGANLNFNISSGTVYRASGNFVSDNSIPDEITISAQIPASFLYRTQTGVGGGFVTAIDPTNYDNAGTITAIGGSSNQATNQYIYLVPGLGLIVQRGQIIYSTLTDAIAGVGHENFVVYPSLINNAILIGILSVTKGCTALNDTATARFFLADKFGQSTGSTAGVTIATLQSSYNNSLVPQISVTDTLTEVTFKSGRASNASNIFAIQNISGSITASINGNGLITGTAFIANGTAGAGYLQLVSQTVPPTAVNGSMIIYTDASNRFSMVRRNNANTADITRTLIFNDVNVSYTFPSQNTDTLAGLGTAQTFTAQQTFSLSNAIRVGNGSFSSDNSALLISRSNTGTINGHAIRDEGTNNSTPDGDGYSSFDSQYTTSGTSLYNHQAGFQARSIYSGSGTLGEWRGFWAAPNHNGTGTITSVKEFHATNPAGSGTITALYGLYIEDLTRGSANFAVYSIGTAPWFSGGQIRIGITAAHTGALTTDGHLSLRAVSGTAKQFNFGYNTTSNYGWMQAANFGTSYSPILINPNGGAVGIGLTGPTALLHIRGGTATANTAPLKFTSGTNLTTAETGAVEYNGTNLFFTRTGTTRENIVCSSAVSSVSPTAPNRTITVNIDGTTYYIHAKTTND